MNPSSLLPHSPTHSSPHSAPCEPRPYPAPPRPARARPTPDPPPRNQSTASHSTPPICPTRAHLCAYPPQTYSNDKESERHKFIFIT